MSGDRRQAAGTLGTNNVYQVAVGSGLWARECYILWDWKGNDLALSACKGHSQNFMFVYPQIDWPTFRSCIRSSSILTHLLVMSQSRLWTTIDISAAWWSAVISVESKCTRLRKPVSFVFRKNIVCWLNPWSGALGLIWQKDFNDLLDSKGVIPRAVRFVEKGDKITIFGLESGTM